MKLSKGIVTRFGLLDMQVCVPTKWSDVEIKQFADIANPCGTKNGWQIRKRGDKLLAGAKEKVACSDNDDRVHVMLDA